MPTLRKILAFFLAAMIYAQSKPAQIIDVNTAPLEKLLSLPGMTPVLAAQLALHAPYSKVEDLSRAGASKELIEAWRKRVTFSSPKQPKPHPEVPATRPAGVTASIPKPEKSQVVYERPKSAVVPTSAVGPSIEEGRLLTNSDVVQLMKSQPTDDAVVADIKAAPRVTFDLSSNERKELVKAGVSPKVLAAMDEKVKRQAAHKNVMVH